MDQWYAMTSHVIAYRSKELLFGMHASNFNCFLDDFNCISTQICCLSDICTAESRMAVFSSLFISKNVITKIRKAYLKQQVITR